MKDEECVENQLSAFAFFSFWDMVIFLLKTGLFSMNFEYKIDLNSKNKNRIIDFSFDSALFASFMKIGPFLKGGSAYP